MIPLELLEDQLLDHGGFPSPGWSLDHKKMLRTEGPDDCVQLRLVFLDPVIRKFIDSIAVIHVLEIGCVNDRLFYRLANHPPLPERAQGRKLLPLRIGNLMDIHIQLKSAVEQDFLSNPSLNF